VTFVQTVAGPTVALRASLCCPTPPRDPSLSSRRRLDSAWPCNGGLVADVQHVGSTAVPRLAAKPILDMLAGVHDPLRSGQAVPVLAELVTRTRTTGRTTPCGSTRSGARVTPRERINCTSLATDLGRHVCVLSPPGSTAIGRLLGAAVADGTLVAGNAACGL
jgi:hypothetical protein